jgi:blue copper oxidase
MRRRNFLAMMGVGLTGAVAHGRAPSMRQREVEPDVELALTAAPGVVPLLDGATTRVWMYSGRAIKGPPGTLENLPGSYLGPVIRLQAGQRVRIHFTSELPEPTITHWHGLDVPAAMDGHPRLMIDRGERYVYEFDVINRAGTYWYHPHHHHRTGAQVYNGLAGLLLVTDRTETTLGLTEGLEEVLCVLQDRTFGPDNQLMYLGGAMMDQVSGFLGHRVLVNGRLASPLSLATRAYRVRLLNGSSSRVYKLAWSDGTPMTVIGTDGGLLERPLQRRYVTLAPGERADVVIDLSQRAVGTEIRLESLAFPSGPFTMMGGGMGMGMGMGRGRGMGAGATSASVPANGAPLDLLTFRVDRREASGFRLPEAFARFDEAWQPDRLDAPTPRLVTLDFRQMQWLLDGRPFEMESVTRDETVRAGAKHLWEFDNTRPAMMGMRLAHPLHLHGRQFRVLHRDIDRRFRADWEALSEGFLDEGWKDTVLIMPGERVQILVRFTDYPGLYLYHCHNLDHEDMGMMRNYRVV